jgi:dTDP-glucose 4,6-dehydratase
MSRARLGETYNIGAHNEWTNQRLVELICDFADELAPELGGDSRRLITHVPDRPGHDRRYAIDAHKIMRELGWMPEQDFRTALRQTVCWYLKHPERLAA